ncbi:conserved hypothetical protein [Crenothrix polyspora]|uniref:DUF1415 domain-containing protein n=1 Tax=Crenothrix polyspora TaxID=360316 RepID=A0A1R4GZZ6_9GAMM|nr:DUF1415 domain-containing protein [Crenothrix polyspora]SJM89567.1 conserved hypothetical protein [Crenothrix polyspora]
MIPDDALVLHPHKIATEAWLKSIVIAHNFCPFAKQTLTRNSIRFSTIDDSAIDTCLQLLMDECERLDTDETIETTLLIYSAAFAGFDDYLDFLNYAETLLIQQGYEGVYQLASFHPDYCFEGAEPDDPANYTNRSPYPMLHLLRESSIEKALASFPNPQNIPKKNVALARKLGLAKMRELLAACY